MNKIGADKMYKGQVSMEFIITAMLILGIFFLGLFIFQSRSDMNLSTSQKLSATDVAFKIARNINNVFLLDENASIEDYVYWNSRGMSVELGEKSVQVYYHNTVSDALLSTKDIVWNVSDFNGLIYFKKIDGRVVVDYN